MRFRSPGQRFSMTHGRRGRKTWHVQTHSAPQAFYVVFHSTSWRCVGIICQPELFLDVAALNWNRSVLVSSPRLGFKACSCSWYTCGCHICVILSVLEMYRYLDVALDWDIRESTFIHCSLLACIFPHFWPHYVVYTCKALYGSCLWHFVCSNQMFLVHLLLYRNCLLYCVWKCVLLL